MRSDRQIAQLAGLNADPVVRAKRLAAQRAVRGAIPYDIRGEWDGDVFSPTHVAMQIENRSRGFRGVLLVDLDDLPTIARYSWCAVWSRNTRSYYAIARVDGRVQRAHRVILGIEDDPRLLVDHISPAATLDNRRKNLRLATRSENMQNRRGATRASTTGVRGLSLLRDGRPGRTDRWCAVVEVRGRKITKRFSLDQRAAAIEWLRSTRAARMPFSSRDARALHSNEYLNQESNNA